jgi:acyl-CoA synthetase (AMP-forming)/AMP-acid ligase II
VSLINKLNGIWADTYRPFLISNGEAITFADVKKEADKVDLSMIKSGDVVALIGDFNPLSIVTFLRLIDMKAIIIPLTIDTVNQYQYFFEVAKVKWVINDGKVQKRFMPGQTPVLIRSLQEKDHAGLILFSSGTTGQPKAVLHDMTSFLKRFDTPKEPMTILSFLLFDHIGGINTMLHMLYNKGTIVTPKERTITSIIEICDRYKVEVLPTTPTFLRMMLLSGVIPERFPKSIKIVTYGTERMDQSTLDALCDLLPEVDFRQTFGMSELGIVRVKSEARNSLYMKIGGEGVETKILNGVLYIRTTTGMVGYLNAASPFDEEGWYNTNDIVEQKGEYIKVVGRVGDVINVGGLKFMASEVENVALSYPGVSFVKVYPKQNPITGQHVEIGIQTSETEVFNINDMMVYLKERLQAHMVPKRIRLEEISIGHRFKKS